MRRSRTPGRSRRPTMPEITELTASTLEALTQQYRAIANNLANVSTPGFKRSRTLFQQVMDRAGQAGQVSATQKVEGRPAVDFSQGTLTASGSSLDLAIEGPGFFRLETPDGPRYTRNGRFRTNAERQLVDAAGRAVGGPIIVPAAVSPSSIRVARDGTVTTEGQRIGRLPVVSFDRPGDLLPVGECCYKAPADMPERDAEGFSVQQGFYEASNVSVVEELVGLITVTQMYEANLKGIRMEDEYTRSLLNVAMG